MVKVHFIYSLSSFSKYGKVLKFCHLHLNLTLISTRAIKSYGQGYCISLVLLHLMPRKWKCMRGGLNSDFVTHLLLIPFKYLWLSRNTVSLFGIISWSSENQDFNFLLTNGYHQCIFMLHIVLSKFIFEPCQLSYHGQSYILLS